MGDSDIEIMKEANDESYDVVEIISEVDQKLCDNVVICIEEKLERLPHVNANCKSIYQVPKGLREMNDKAYTPQFISIGPFHYGTRTNLIANEHYKVQGFFNFLRRLNNKYKIQSLEDSGHVKITTSLLKVLVEKACCSVKEAHNCYAEPINMKEEEFFTMMLVDACFIVEFLILWVCENLLQRRGKFFQIQDNVDFSFYHGIEFDILIDLIKLENQVPFILLQNLFDLIPKLDDDPMISSLIRLTDIALKGFGLVSRYEIDDLYYKEPKHLLDFLSFYFLPLPPDDMQNKQDEIKNIEKKNNDFRKLLSCLWNKKPDHEKNSYQQWRLSPPSTTELCEAGITIKVADNENLCLTNISFKNGVLEIPPIIIESTFEIVVRNLIAFDHYPAGNQKQYVIQYVLFLDDLISTEEDVHLLVKAGVIINTFGGSDKEISDMFNNFSKFAIFPVTSHFDDMSQALRVHCNGRWNKAKASLKRNYFNTPWAVISFIAATFLILLTLLQTIFSAISAFPS
ncbi:UPF0481 protein At3g47200-like [Benincasa hispida]|uniref:UPF0481 protein At3g47200-like n=1 Tax=Benincasa hispida TaxID=102211 RepID=UPI001900887A|nr:UPF0481 protein At3g47200-like [Benincasa hispida]XP_038884452.1 UPF0481 protein At3g47200-like [Benincasa hispida]XP_038884453.1 UPF0481 protein At3g47200-like [Benincasa hispida]